MQQNFEQTREHFQPVRIQSIEHSGSYPPLLPSHRRPTC